MSRRPLGLLMTVIVVALLVGAVIERRNEEPRSPRDELARRLDAASAPARFAMRYSRGGTRVLDCIAVNLRYTARVDTEAQRMVITVAGANRPSVVLEADSLLVHRSLFQQAPGQAEWLSVARPFSTAARNLLTSELGVDLGAAVTSPRLPAAGAELAASALNVAGSVRRLGSAEIDGRLADGYRIAVQREKYQQAATTVEPTDAKAASLPVFDVWVDTDDQVRRISVRPQSSTKAAEDGWTMDFASVRSVIRPETTNAAPLNATDLQSLRAAKPGCELPVVSNG